MLIKEHPGKSYTDFIQPFSFLILVLSLLDIDFFSSFTVFSSVNLFTFGHIKGGCHNCSLRFLNLHEDTCCHSYKGEEQRNQFYLNGKWKKKYIFLPHPTFRVFYSACFFQRQCCLTSEFCDSLQNLLHACSALNFFSLRFCSCFLRKKLKAVMSVHHGSKCLLRYGYQSYLFQQLHQKFHFNFCMINRYT